MLQHKSKKKFSKCKEPSNSAKHLYLEYFQHAATLEKCLLKNTNKQTNKNNDTAAFQKFKSGKLLLFLNIQLVFLSSLPHPLVFLKFISNF